MLEETKDVVGTNLINRFLNFVARFSSPGEDGQNKLLVDDPKLEKFILVLQELTNFIDQKHYLFADCAFG